MKITKKRKNQNYTNYTNTEYKEYKEYKNIEDINNKIKEIDNKINEINININKNGNDKINTTNNKEKILNENNNNKNNISIEEIKYEFLNINKRLDEIIKIINKEIFNDYKTKNVIVCQDNICIIPTPLEKTKIPILIREENKIQKIEEFELIRNEKNINIKNKNYKFKNLPLIKKNTIHQIKRVETFEIIKNKKNFVGNRRLPLIKKPLNYQIINQIYIPGIPGINNPEENIQKADENELLRIYLPIPEFVIEDINDFVLYALKKNPLLIQYNSQIEFKPKK